MSESYKNYVLFLNNWIIIVKKWNDKYIYLKNLIRKITIDQFELIIHLRFVRFFIILTYIYYSYHNVINVKFFFLENLNSSECTHAKKKKEKETRRFCISKSEENVYMKSHGFEVWSFATIFPLPPVGPPAKRHEDMEIVREGREIS